MTKHDRWSNLIIDHHKNSTNEYQWTANLKTPRTCCNFGEVQTAVTLSWCVSKVRHACFCLSCLHFPSVYLLSVMSAMDPTSEKNLARTNTQTRQAQTTTDCWPIDTPLLCACMLHKREAYRLLHNFRLWFTNVDGGSNHLHARLPGICLRNASANSAR